MTAGVDADYVKDSDFEVLVAGQMVRSNGFVKATLRSDFRTGKA